eukprot:TRINITY_DN1142_c0_g1_i3.p1 TRINITY_DN1142_c0_g1~~TRINITY_DN1142_c0_g1_i3.p1  ORF type:complete len:524 (+),score=153.49 TRINITY_DN1142_c0_g1_i3:1076-2647(+)
MPSRIASVAPSSSAPDLRRDRLEKILTKAKPPSELRRSGPERQDRKRPPGGAPYKSAPPVRDSTATRRNASVTFPEEDTHEAEGVARDRMRTPAAAVQAGQEAALRASRTSSMPALAPRQPGNTTVGSLRDTATPGTRKAGSYIKQLVGNDEGQGALHWRLVQEMDALDGLIQENVNRQKLVDQQTRQRSNLMEQVQEAKQKDSEYRSSMQRWGGKLKEDAERWQREEQTKRQELRQALQRHNHAQAQFQEDGRRRRQEEAAMEARLDAEMTMQAQAAKRRQEALEDRKRQRQQETAREMANAAREAERSKAESKRLEAMKDFELMRLQEAMLDEQDRKRQEAKQKIVEKQNQARSAYEAGAGNSIAKLQKEEEDRARRQQMEKDSKDEAAHREKQRKQKQMEMDGAAFVQKQLQEQAMQREREREEQRQRREKIEKDAANGKDEERRKAQERRDRERENAAYLQKQISSKAASQLAGEQMTQIEQSMNRDRLERARKPENLQMLFRSKQGQYAMARTEQGVS